ncbi:unnamed protein product [Caenorhabditis bovis]|uniref:Protein phosphatase 1 regulatory subunit 12B n=1 Tax=Caenorhabditis bovis TaxID=2654633 RepID=A0A8S1ESX0_9PELO|nr:unnamed protein product [Caenorhabditis bovis]
MGQDDEDDAFMLQAKQQITYNVINKRKDQLRRWQGSEMNAEPARRTKRPKVQFQDSDVFLSACMSGDEEEVDELLEKGADINTCTVDGLTALHQSVIDSKPEMVRFLCEKGADVNAQDNEGWTPLHAAACCGNVAIVRYLCQHGADLAIVNSDKELALDLAEDEQCRELLEEEYRRQNIDINACRDRELNVMLRDAKTWLATGEYRDVPHYRTGGTAMHVAAARGYTQILEMLIKAGGNVRAQDKDGWTPLHAAAHWAERDACKILLENNAELSDTTFAGQDVLAVADKEIVDYLIELGEAARNREKRKSPITPSTPVSVLQEKNHRVHEDHILSSGRKKDIQHKDQHSENEFIHHIPSTPLSSASTSESTNTSTTSTTITIGSDGAASNSREMSKESSASDETRTESEDVEAEDEAEVDEDELEEDEEEIEGASESENKITVIERNGNVKNPSPLPSGTNTDASRSPSASRSSDIYSTRSSSERDTSVETTSESLKSGSLSTSSKFASTSSQSSGSRSVSVPPIVQSETPRSSLESSSVGSGDQTVSATLPIAPSSAPPKAIHQSPSSWINRGLPLFSRSSTSSVSRSSVTPASDIVSPPTSLNSQHPISVPSSSASAASSAAGASTPSTPSNVMSATISSMAKNSPSPAGSVTITATFTKPSTEKPDEVFRSPSYPTNVPWASLWHSSNDSSSHIRSQIEQLKNVSSSSINTLPRVSAFRPPIKTSSSSVSLTSSSQSQPAKIAEYPKIFVPHQMNPVKMSRWQSKTVNESEAERRNNSRMQRQHRRSTQGVTKEQLEEASRFAIEESSRRHSAAVVSPNQLPSTNNLVRLASEEKDLSSNSESLDMPRNGDVSTSATLSLNSPSTNAANLRRKSQGFTISRSNRRATGPVNPEDLVHMRSSDSQQQPTPPSPSMSLRLAAAPSNSQPYSPASVRSVTGTVPTMTSRFAEKAHSLPPSNGNTSNHSISSRSAVVAGLSTAPSVRSGPLSSTASRFAPSSSLSSNNSNPSSSQSRPTETNLNYKALYEKEKAECERLKREVEELRRSQTVDNWRNANSANSWRTRNSSPSSQSHVNLSVAKSTSLASFDENERKAMERKIADLELQLKTSTNLRMENQRLKEENGALVRVISKMTI